MLPISHGLPGASAVNRPSSALPDSSEVNYPVPALPGPSAVNHAVPALPGASEGNRPSPALPDATASRTEAATNLIAEIVASAAAPICLTSSFQTEDMVVLHLLLQRVPDIPVIFLETGYHFPALLAYRDRMAAAWNLNLINALPTLSLTEHEAHWGKLHIVQPTDCCKLRKVEPLMRSLEPFSWWFTGLRREQSPTRVNLGEIEDHTTPTGKKMKKVSPLAAWTWPEVLAYAEVHSIPRLELYDQGYTSIGCEPCTAIPAAGADPRSGRWGGHKLECGIHTFSEKS